MAVPVRFGLEVTKSARLTMQALAKEVRRVAVNTTGAVAADASRSLRGTARTRFKKRPWGGGKPFYKSFGSFPFPRRGDRTKTLYFDVGSYAAVKKRRSRTFALTDLFQPGGTISTASGRRFAVPMWNANFPMKGGGGNRTPKWPRDLIADGWTLFIPPSQRGKKNPVLYGYPGASKGRKQGAKARPLYILLKSSSLPNRFDFKKVERQAMANVDKHFKRATARMDARLARFSNVSRVSRAA